MITSSGTVSPLVSALLVGVTPGRGQTAGHLLDGHQIWYNHSWSPDMNPTDFASLLMQSPPKVWAKERILKKTVQSLIVC